MKNGIIKLVAIFLLAPLLLISCASIIKGTTEDVSVNSSPVGNVKIVADSGKVFYDGKVPANVKLSKKEEYVVTITLEGYKPTTININKEFEMWFIGNLLCGGLIGGVIDLVDGAVWKLEPNEINVSLQVAKEDREESVYVVFRAIDNEGNLRSQAVPLIKI